MNTKGNGKWSSIRAYILIEVFALLAAAAFLVGRYYVTRASVRSEIETYLDQLYDAASEARAGLDDGAMLTDSWASVSGLRLSGVRQIWKYYYRLPMEDGFYKGRESSFYGNFVVGVYTKSDDAEELSGAGNQEVRTKSDKLFFNGDIVAISYRASEDKTIVWDLTKLFPEEMITELLMELTDGGSYAYRYFYQDMDVEAIYARETENGELIPTRVTILMNAFGYRYILQSEDYRDTDTRIWLMPTDTPWTDEDDVPEGVFQPSVEMCVLGQNGELSEILDDPQKWAELDSDRYYLAEISYEGRSKKTRYGGDADLTLAPKGSMAVYSNSEKIYPTTTSYYVLVDVYKVVWNRIGWLAVFTVALAQTFAVIIMIIRNVLKRRKDEQEQLRNTFIGAMAHELKEPVDVTRRTAGQLAEGMDPEEKAGCLEVLTQESESMNDILNRMLTYTRVMDGKVTLREQMTDIVQLVESVLPEYSGQLEAKRMKVQFVKTAPKELLCDPDLMRTVIENILSNAVLYGEEDSIVRIEVNHARMTVWNQTCSRLSEKDLKGIWKPLYEREQNGERTTGGIGLAMCAGILGLHGAAYGAYNEGMGLTVFFDFKDASKTCKLRKYAWINLITSALDLVVSVIWYWVFRISGPNWYRGDDYMVFVDGKSTAPSPMWFLRVSCMFMVCAILFAWAYTKASVPKLLKTKSPWESKGKNKGNGRVENGEIEI